MRSCYKPFCRFCLPAIAIAVFGILGCHASVVANQTAPDQSSSHSVSDPNYPNEDAVILLWEQTWTVDNDGTVHRRDHKKTKLFNHRPVRSSADPRIDFNAATDKVEIHVAQTHLPDGRIMPVPDYSFNPAAADDVAGWPEYIGWQQTVVSYSAVQPGCVMELDYEVTTEAGVHPWLSADLRISDNYPVEKRIVRVAVPSSMGIHLPDDGINPKPVTKPNEPSQGMTLYTWTFENLPADPAEPACLPWQMRSKRLRFTTCDSAELWAKKYVSQVSKAAKPTKDVERFAKDIVKHEVDPKEQARLIYDHMHKTFNYVDSPKTMVRIEARGANEVLSVNYGNPLESACLLTAALRSLDLDPTLLVAVDATAYGRQVAEAPTESVFAGVVLRLDTPEGPVHIHPRHGLFENPGGWGRHLLITPKRDGGVAQTYVHARGEGKSSEIRINGSITIDDKAKATGDLRMKLTGLFYDPSNLDSASSQESLVNGFVGRVADGFSIDSYAVGTLSGDVFQATAKVEADELTKAGSQRIVLLGDGPAFLRSITLPLGRSYRNTSVHLDGAFKENVDLVVNLPEGKTASIVPTSLPVVKGSWGKISQTVEADGNEIRFKRVIEINKTVLSPDEFATIREAIVQLQANKSLMVSLSS